MRLRVLYHGNCFDGCSSAGLFTRFFREAVAHEPVEVAFRPLEHKGDAQPFLPSFFDGDQNVCVDFRYSQDPHLTWWFDHHASAFQLPGDEAHFRADTSGRKFYDPTAKSCARFLARTVTERFGWDPRPVQELIDWSEIIDGALFTDAKMAVEMKEPALKLMSWVENNRDPALSDRFIEDLVRLPLAETVALPYIAKTVANLMEQHEKNIEILRQAARIENGVVFFDLSDRGGGVFNKFISYYLFPEARYVVGVTMGARAKISVGSNPWSPIPRKHAINAICERYGGGGHPVVGAVSLPRTEIERAREIARVIAQELQT